MYFHDTRILLPHELFSHLYHQHPDEFRRRILPSTEKLQNFWREMQLHPQLRDHPLTGREDYWRKCVPISFHGDAVPVKGLGKKWQNGATFYSWTSIVAGIGLNADFNFYIWLLWKDMTKTGWTLDRFYRILCWSFLAMWTGKFPECDWKGNPSPMAGMLLADGLFCCLWVIRADLMHLRDELKLPCWSSNYPCAFCPVHKNCMHCYQDGVAAWLETLWTATDWRASCWNKHPLFNCHPGVSILTVGPDLMHIKHLGVDLYFFGTILALLVYEILSQTAAQNLIVIFNEIKQYYKKNGIGCRFTKITLDMFVKNRDEPWKTFQELKGKAGEIKDFGGALLHSWQEHMHKTGEHKTLHRKIELALTYNVEIETIVKTHASEWRFKGTIGTDFRRAVFNFLLIFNALGDEFSPANRTDDKCGFNVTTKAHYLAHVALTACYLNPRLAWCYSGEDMMHKFRDLLQACTRGNQGGQSSLKFLQKYVVGLTVPMLDDDYFIVKKNLKKPE